MFLVGNMRVVTLRGRVIGFGREGPSFRSLLMTFGEGRSICEGTDTSLTWGLGVVWVRRPVNIICRGHFSIQGVSRFKRLLFGTVTIIFGYFFYGRLTRVNSTTQVTCRTYTSTSGHGQFITHFLGPFRGHGHRGIAGVRTIYHKIGTSVRGHFAKVGGLSSLFFVNGLDGRTTHFWVFVCSRFFVSSICLVCFGR